MTKRPALIVPAVTVGIVLLVLAVLSFDHTGSAHHHLKHGIAALLPGLGCLVYAWFQTGSTDPGTRSETSGVDWAADGTVD